MVAVGFVLEETGSEYFNRINQHRVKTDSSFADSSTSILSNEDRQYFNGLPYFEVDTKYAVQANFKRIRFGKKFEMKTSTDRLPIYKPYGRLSFVLNGSLQTLTVYQNIALSKKEEYKNYLFCPFQDQTNGMQSYGGGRYLDVDLSDLKEGVLLLDFNLAYNPYCAYNSKYSCPIPPKENKLLTKIEAGVKKWDSH